jgi:hypothetical protein
VLTVQPAIDAATTVDPSAAATNKKRAFIRRPPFDEGRARSTQPRTTISITTAARAAGSRSGHIRPPRALAHLADEAPQLPQPEADDPVPVLARLRPGQGGGTGGGGR